MISEFAYSVLDMPILMREEYDDASRKRNLDAKVRNSIQMIPYALRSFGSTIRLKNTEFKLCKLLLIRNRCIDVFSIIRHYLFAKYEWYENDSYSLPEKKCMRVVSKLIHLGCITNIPDAIKIANYYDIIHKNNYLTLKRDLIKDLTPICENLDINVFNYWL